MNYRLPLAILALSGIALPLGHASARQTELRSADAVTALELRGDDVIAVLNETKAADEVFGPEFLSAVPSESLAAMNAQLTTQFGAAIGVETITATGPYQAAIALRFERAIGRGQIVLSPNAPHLITGLQLSSFEPIDDSPAKIAADIAALPGTAGVYFAPLSAGKPAVIAIDADRQFAIGSTFKLYVLAALTRSIADGERAWDDVVRLDTKSLPSGQMQNWPDGSPITLHTLAAMMISISDNTATDMLIAEVGRSAVEAELVRAGHSDAALNTPFLTTLELFALKADQDAARAFVGGGEETQRAAIQALSGRLAGDPDKANAAGWQAPRMIDTLEWFASGRDLAGLMQQMVSLGDPVALEIMAINPALPEPIAANWAYTGYKGGSEPGVLNLSWLLRDQAGEWFTLTLSWNNTQAPVDNTALELLAHRIIALPPTTAPVPD